MSPDQAEAAEPPVVTGSREQLLHLLAEAAEIEHTLMCSYLYAAFSLKQRGDPGLSDEEAAATERWRKAIMSVATEEMGHLLMVANLTVAIGGRPHFARPAFPIAPGYFPSGVVVRLAGFSRETLEHFIFLERPGGEERADGEGYDQDDYTREQRHDGLMPSAQDYATIGHLYEAIRVNLERLSEQLGEPGLFLSGGDGQVGRDIVDFEGVARITTLADAQAAIDVIVEQGEGSPSDRDVSHYRSFLGIADEFDALTRDKPDFTPAWPVADNPVLRRPADPDDRQFIDAPEAARLLDFACATYGLLLRLLVQSFGRRGDHAAAEQDTLIGAAIDLMHVLGQASTRLARMPASADAPGATAGMSFTMLRGVEPFLSGGIEERLIREQLTALSAAARAILPGTASERTLVKLAGEFALQ